MKVTRIPFALLLPLALLAGVAVAESVERTVPAAADARIEIESLSGEVILDAWDRDEVRIVGTLGDDVEELVVEGSGSRISIEVEVPERGGRYWSRRDLDADLRITVPSGASIDAETVSASISSVGIRGSLDLESVSGDIEVADAASPIDIATVSGSISVRRSPVAVSAESVSGSVELDGVGSRIEADSVSGRVEVRAGAVERADLETVSGSIEFTGSLAPGARLDVSTHSGNASVSLPADTSANFDISTYSGSVDNQMGPGAIRESRWVPSKSVEFSTGNGDAKVTIETFSGNVRLRHQ